MSANENEVFFKFFYCDTQEDEAYAFQEEKGWKMLWGSDYQGLNGDTLIVYREASDVPEWLQNYVREEEGKQTHRHRLPRFVDDEIFE